MFFTFCISPFSYLVEKLIIVQFILLLVLMNLKTESEEIPEDDSIEEEFSLRSSLPKWGPIIAVLSLIGITYGVQRTALALYAEQLYPGEIFPSGENFPNFLVFISVASTIIAYGLSKGISGFFSSSISVRFTRKRTLITGLSLLIVGSITIAFGGHLWALILGNIFIGGGLGFFFTSSMSALTDIAGTKSSAFSVGSMEFSVYFGSSVYYPVVDYIFIVPILPSLVLVVYDDPQTVFYSTRILYDFSLLHNYDF